ncbi:PEP-CTERM sorting domain-containing protein [Rubritalea spongiae]|uniref:PEP-CTERM sorting domain-containing protein n=1 Tax=Rubritalea spongiae TaxID=430797 RepID=A0ABW5E4T3_9BACT
MKTRQLFLPTCTSLILASSAYAVTITQNDVSNNQAWNLSGFSQGGTELYDERSLTIDGANGYELQEVRIILDTTGNYDDSIGIDMTADGVIDFLATQTAAYATPGIGSGKGNYQPWVDATPFGLDARITSAGTTIVATWNGVEIILTGNRTSDPSGGFNDISGFTLQDWSNGNIDNNGTITSNNFTSTILRLGSLNDDGPSSHGLSFDIDAVVFKDKDGETTVFDPDGDGVPPTVGGSTTAVPEPSSVSLLLLGASAALFRRKRK